MPLPLIEGYWHKSDPQQSEPPKLTMKNIVGFKNLRPIEISVEYKGLKQEGKGKPVKPNFDSGGQVNNRKFFPPNQSAGGPQTYTRETRELMGWELVHTENIL